MKFNVIRIVKLCESAIITLFSLGLLVYVTYLYNNISNVDNFYSAIAVALAVAFFGIAGLFLLIVSLFAMLKIIFDKPDNAKYGGYVILFLINLDALFALPSLLKSAIENKTGGLVVLWISLILIFIGFLVTDVMIILDRTKRKKEQKIQSQEQNKKEMEYL